MFSAIDKNTKSKVAIKKLKRDLISHDVEKEGDLLKHCRSDFIISVSDSFITETEVWVTKSFESHGVRSSWNFVIVDPLEAMLDRRRYSKNMLFGILRHAACLVSYICTISVSSIA